MASQNVSNLAGQCLSGARSLCQAGLDFVYPRVCPVCNRETAETRTGRTVDGPTLCNFCVEEMLPPIDDVCLRCGAPVGPFLDTSSGCIHCRRDHFVFENVVSLGVYNGLLQKVCLRLKHSYNGPLAAAMGELLWERASTKLRGSGVDISLPVPYYWTRRIARLNHAPTTISRLLAHRLQVKFSTHILVKVRRTPPQLSLRAKQRRTNLRKAFAVRGTSKLAGRTVLLVDDILTTGTTANEAAKVLLRAGVRRVIVAVLARGIGKSSGGVA